MPRAGIEPPSQLSAHPSSQRALFCIEEMTKRRTFESLTIHGGCLGAWGAAFVARGARIEGAGLETLRLVDCR